MECELVIEIEDREYAKYDRPGFPLELQLREHHKNLQEWDNYQQLWDDLRRGTEQMKEVERQKGPSHNSQQGEVHKHLRTSCTAIKPPESVLAVIAEEAPHVAVLTQD